MRWIAFTAYGVWATLTVVGLFSFPLGKALSRRDRLGLLPRPILFAPLPVNADRIVLVAHQPVGASSWSDWVDLNTHHLQWTSAWWRPGRRIVTLTNRATTVLMAHSLTSRRADLRLVPEYLFLLGAAENAVPPNSYYRFAIAEVRGLRDTAAEGVPLFVSSKHHRTA